MTRTDCSAKSDVRADEMRADFGSEQKLERDVNQRVDGIERVAGAGDLENGRVRRARGNGAAFLDRDAVVALAVHDKKRHAQALGRGEDVQTLAMLLDVVEACRRGAHDLLRPRV